MRPGEKLIPWVDPRLKASSSPIGGTGLFVQSPIDSGEILIIWGGTVFTHADILSGKANPETIAVLDDDLYLADPVDSPLAEEYTLNHSCDPNAWMLDAITLIARHPIAPGEEVTADYALWLFNQDWKLYPCRCGSPLCRRRVTDQDWRLPELQSRYAGHFTPFLNRLIEQDNLETKTSGIR
ncbi:MAG: SET domain-containing protein-lysine N-methyltransferase [Chloroflexi bacterium]|nr:SET domain-containing protein-lysine N-methyltransferase [Chloroflexota bacterium]